MLVSTLRALAMKKIVRSLWWKLTIANVVVTLLGSLLAVMALGPALDARAFREVVQPRHLASLLERDRQLLEGRLDDRDLRAGLLRAMRQSLQDAQSTHGLYGIAYSSYPRVSLAIYDENGYALERFDTAGLELPATWLPGPKRLETISDAERLLVLPLQPTGMLVVRHFADFSVVKNLQSTLDDAGSFLWFLVLMVSIPGSMLGVGLTYWLARRLRRMAEASDAWAKGDFSPRLDDNSSDELGRHALALNTMAARLRDHLRTEQQLATLQERQRLARELHDGVKQKMFATDLQLHAALQWLDRAPFRASEALRRAQIINRSVSKDLTELLTQLRLDTASQTLGSAVQNALLPWVGQVEIRLSVPSDLVISPTTTHEISRVVAEAVANTVRHAEANLVEVRVSVDERRLFVEIVDDGKGFDTARSGEGMGLASMRERATQLPSGMLELDSSRNGTRLVLSMEYESEPAA